MAKRESGPTEFGPTFLKAWRVYRGHSLEELAERARVDIATISRMERGLVGYRQSTLERLAEALACSPSELLARHPENAEDLWRLLRNATPEQRRRVSAVAEALLREDAWIGQGERGADDAVPAPGRAAARAIGADGRRRAS